MGPGEFTLLPTPGGAPQPILQIGELSPREVRSLPRGSGGSQNLHPDPVDTYFSTLGELVEDREAWCVHEVQRVGRHLASEQQQQF